MSEDWRVDSHDKEIKQLTGDLYGTKEELRTELREANEKISKLERRPSERATNIKAAIGDYVRGGLIGFLIVAVASKY